jgi:D-alanyl-D-alanine carboxypeptidase
VSEDCFGGSDKRQTEEEPVQDQKEVKYTLDKMNLIHAMNLTF